MKRTTWVLLGLGLLGILGLVALAGATAPRLGAVLAEGARPLVEPTLPACTSHSAKMFIEASRATPLVGQTLVITTTLLNDGCTGLGLPKYTIVQATDAVAPVLEPSVPISVVHYLGIGPSQRDAAVFQFDVVSTGTVTFTATASFEVHLGYPGPAYWSVASTGPRVIVVPPSDAEVLALDDAAHALGCTPQLRVAEGVYEASCAFQGGSLTARIQPYSCACEAAAALADACAGKQQAILACQPGCTWGVVHHMMHYYSEYFVAQVGQSVVSVESFDWSAFNLLPPRPRALAGAVHAAGVARGLWSACDALWLPGVFGNVTATP